MADVQNPDAGADTENEVAKPEVPEWVPEKFRSNPEAFGKSYQELEKSFHETRQELREQQKAFEEFVNSQQQAQPETNTDALYQAYEQDPVATMAWLAEQAVTKAVEPLQKQFQQQQQPLVEGQHQLLAHATNQLIAERVPDWADYQQRVSEEISANPDLIAPFLATPETAAAALERVYKSVKFDVLQNQNQTLAEQKAETDRRAKLQAQTLTGAAGRPEPQDGDTEYWERIVNAETGRYK